MNQTPPITPLSFCSHPELQLVAHDLLMEYPGQISRIKDMLVGTAMAEWGFCGTTESCSHAMASVLHKVSKWPCIQIRGGLSLCNLEAEHFP